MNRDAPAMNKLVPFLVAEHGGYVLRRKSPLDTLIQKLSMSGSSG
jgi:hypothetical protein